MHNGEKHSGEIHSGEKPHVQLTHTSNVHKANSGESGRPYVEKMQRGEQHCRTSNVHKANIEDCSSGGAYVHKVNSSAHKGLLCAHTGILCAETWQSVEHGPSSFGGKYRNGFGQKYPQVFGGEHAVSIGGQECANSIGEGFGAERSRRESGKCGCSPPTPSTASSSPPTASYPATAPSPPHPVAVPPIYANVRRLQLPCLGE